MVTQEQSSSSPDHLEDGIEERNVESSNGESEGEIPDDPAERKQFHLHEPEIGPGEENAVLALWGLFESLGDSEPFAVYLEFDALDSESPDENEDNENEDSDEQETPESVDLRENLVALLSSEEKTLYDPSLDWNEFYSRLINYNIASRTIPEATLEKYRETLENYANDTRIQWINEFVDSELGDEIENWLDALRNEFFSPDLGYYDLHLQFVNSDQKTRDDEEGEHASPDPSEQEEEPETTASVKVTYVSNPPQGVPVLLLNEGQQVFFRILGRAVEQLPNDLVDKESSKQRSVPMVGPITSIEDHPDEAEHLDSAPEDYRKVSVEIEPAISGTALVFKDDHIKVPDDDPERPVRNRDPLLLGLVVLLIIVLISLLIFFL